MDQLSRFVPSNNLLNLPLQHKSFQHHTYLYHAMLAFVDHSIKRCNSKSATSLR
jgi:hypothetical protein